MGALISLLELQNFFSIGKHIITTYLELKVQRTGYFVYTYK